MKTLETLGTICGVLGAFLVALKIGDLGYQFFAVSSVCLLVSATYYKQRNYIVLQFVFLVANILGLINYL